jgi:hypothetical protein
MSYRLNAIFILDKNKRTDEELLKDLGISTRLLPKNQVDFFETNNRWNKLFVGNFNDCQIICHGKTSNRAFEEDNFAAAFTSAEITAFIWDESTEAFGFAHFQKGKLIRKVLVTAGNFEFDLGFQIDEESKIKDTELLDSDEMLDIIDSEGKEALQQILKTERTIHSTNRIVKRYLKAELVSIEEEILLEEYA